VLNGAKITGPTPLKNDDRIKLGPLLLVFSDKPRGGGAEREAPTVTDVRVNVQFTEENDDQAEITSEIDVGSNRFGTLEVQPQAKLKALIQLSQVLAGTVELERLLPRILDVLFSVFPGADRGCIMLKDVASGQMTPRAMKHRRDDEDETVKLSRTIIRKVLETKAGILSADAV
ncbi:MAG: stage II sporulation protein E, partial [Planctomycetaceae bacterium]